jgi:hypothetical protein
MACGRFSLCDPHTLALSLLSKRLAPFALATVACCTLQRLAPLLLNYFILLI